MGLFDDLLGPIRDIASVKNDVTQSFTEVKDTLIETKDQITSQTSGVGEAISNATKSAEQSDLETDR